MTISVSRVVPILRMFDEKRAKEFYVDYAGFTVDWEHRFDDGAPLYMQVSRDGIVLHLSEHHGDGTPGTAVHVECTGVVDYHAELHTKGYRFYNPGIDEGHDGGPCLNLLDPFGNTVRLWQRAEA